MEFTCRIDGWHLTPNFNSSLYSFPQAHVFGSLAIITIFCLRTRSSRCFSIKMIVVFVMRTYSLTPKLFALYRCFSNVIFSAMFSELSDVLFREFREFWNSFTRSLRSSSYISPRSFSPNEVYFDYCVLIRWHFVIFAPLALCIPRLTHAYENLQNFKRLLIEFNL